MKFCIKCGKYPVFSNGYCKYHYIPYYKRPSVKKPLTDGEITNQVELFKKIWNSRPHYSELSREPLDKYYGTSFWLNCFAHVLPKGMYPNAKLWEENIILVTPDEHFAEHNKTQEYRSQMKCDWDIFFQRKEYLKNKYSEFMKNLI